MKNQIIRENGYYWNLADDGAQYLWRHDEKAARCRAANRGEVPLTFRQKLRRFFRNLRRELHTAALEAADYMWAVQHGMTVEEVAFFRENDLRPSDKVLEMGSGRYE